MRRRSLLALVLVTACLSGCAPTPSATQSVSSPKPSAARESSTHPDPGKAAELPAGSSPSVTEAPSHPTDSADPSDGASFAASACAVLRDDGFLGVSTDDSFARALEISHRAAALDQRWEAFPGLVQRTADDYRASRQAASSNDRLSDDLAKLSALCADVRVKLFSE